MHWRSKPEPTTFHKSLAVHLTCATDLPRTSGTRAGRDLSWPIALMLGAMTAGGLAAALLDWMVTR